jgi:hypothetical protein
MTLTPDSFRSSDMDDFAKFLGMDGLDADMFYESYYQLNVDDEYEEDEYREETHYQTY